MATRAGPLRQLLAGPGISGRLQGLGVSRRAIVSLSDVLRTIEPVFDQQPPGPAVLTEAVVRESLRQEVLASVPKRAEAVYEFWVPRSNERADVVVIGAAMLGYEIKTDRDTLRRLPRQVEAYSRLFDRCTVVLADRHLEAALVIVPEWWGVVTILADRTPLSFRVVRSASPNRGVDPETLVRLLWREEARSVISALGADIDPRASRASMWQQLLNLLDLEGLKEAVRKALLERDLSLVRFPNRRSSAPDVRR